MSNDQPHHATIVALSGEVDAASALLRHGFTILEGYKFASRDADPLFVCFAGGCEKLLKLSAGLHALYTSGAWPSKTVMKNQWGHDIIALDAHVRELIANNIAASTAPGYVRELLDEVASDGCLKQILATLSQYATQGRFYNLDCLASSPQPHASPAELWEQMQQSLIRPRPELLARFASQQWTEARQEVNHMVAESMRQWCELIARAWMTGVLGRQAKQWAVQLDLCPKWE